MITSPALPPFALPAEAGTNRVTWDIRYDAPPAFSHSYEINANPGLTPPSPEGPLAPPGVYTVSVWHPVLAGRSETVRIPEQGGQVAVDFALS